MQVREFNKKNVNRLPPEVMEDKVKKLRKEHEKLVKGKFEFTDAGGGWIEFGYRYFPGDPLLVVKIYHDEVTDLPMGIVKHINNTVRKVRTFQSEMQEGQRGVPSSFQRISRIKFTPMEFV